MIENKTPQVLNAIFVDRKTSPFPSLHFIFYYEIFGEKLWLEKFAEQKAAYIGWNKENNKLIYSVPWYYGKSCPICVNEFNGKLFLNINEHEKQNSICKELNTDYWKILAEKENDENWLTRTNGISNKSDNEKI
ncbi:MAG TPA: hypothetical protein VJY62_02170 [Bacteroidia bacterium]|nr:hypothetical protein [Bacteroidia bacterium]